MRLEMPSYSPRFFLSGPLMGSDGRAWLPLSSPALEKTAQISVFSEICEDSVGMSEVSEDSTWHAVGALVILINFTAGKGHGQAGC